MIVVSDASPLIALGRIQKIELLKDLLLIDEAKGRRIAEIRKINTIGTLGCLVLAKKRGLIPSVKPLLEALSISGFRMDEKLYQRALSLALETS